MKLKITSEWLTRHLAAEDAVTSYSGVLACSPELLPKQDCFCPECGWTEPAFYAWTHCPACKTERAKFVDVQLRDRS